ncbi:MAG: 3-oxoacyl-[acyl-carrier-protein] reductase [Bdellovibrionota bacterium]|nr:MAG: 3-oxoacyl-[acyl-carrier-protein] reductase [Bdellovibrionota bacterium]
MTNQLRIEGRVALVTGGSRGIGRAISVALAQAGATVWVNYQSNAGAAEETVALCEQTGGKARAIHFNVGESAAVDAGISHVIEESGGIDILINNAGISHDGLVIRLKDEDWSRTMRVNLDGAFYCARAVAKTMMKARRGRIVNMSSIVGEMGNPGQVPYVASKAGLIGLTKALAKELASRGITVNAITPGFIDTDMTAALPEKVREQYLQEIPLGRFGSPDEVAQLVLFLASDMSSYITGQVVGINGGLYM